MEFFSCGDVSQVAFGVFNSKLLPVCLNIIKQRLGWKFFFTVSYHSLIQYFTMAKVWADRPFALISTPSREAIEDVRYIPSYRLIILKHI